MVRPLPVCLHEHRVIDVVPVDGADLRGQVEAQMPRLTRSIRAILTPYRGGDSKLETIESFETINMSCRVLVLIGHRGQDVYDAVRLELEKSLRDAVAFLVGADRGVSWLHHFVTTMEWYDRRVVRRPVRLVVRRATLIFLLGSPSVIACRSGQGILSPKLVGATHPVRSQAILEPACADQQVVHRELCLDIIQSTVYRNPRCVSRISEGISQWAQDERKPKVPDASGDVDMEVYALLSNLATTKN